MTFREIYKDIYLVHGKNGGDVARAFIRPQEYYENPDYQGKIFSTEEIESWYRKLDGKAEINYYEDIVGFNVPGASFRPFISGLFKNPTKQEAWLVKNVANVRRKKFYVIGVAQPGKNDKTLHHELAHAFFYLRPSYRTKVTKIILSHKNLGPLQKGLTNQGYAPHVMIDEIHAYFATGDYKTCFPSFGIDYENYEDFFEQLNPLLLNELATAKVNSGKNKRPRKARKSD